MTLSAGTKLGPYEIVSPIGAGGMGEVYKARDTRLERTVAIKVLPERLSSSPEIRQRFEREAKTISQLSHPHICALYDVGHEGATEYLVMEYLEGETLTERLLKGALQAEQVLRYGIEIADALDKAHRQGIVHRDLKPGNIMLTTSGVKLLDFGLAKAVAPVSPVSSVSVLPTQAGTNLTREGTILGTFQYMAPEQLEGREADARTDIFAFGAVLHEMATGQKAFSGRSQASLIGAILKDEPPSISTIQPMTPPALDRVVKTCLAKDPEGRWETAHDVRLQLQWIAEGGSLAGLPAPVAARRKRGERLLWGVVGLATGAGILLLLRPLLPRRTALPAQPVTSLSIVCPPDAPPAVYGTSLLALSPNGRSLAYVAQRRGARQLYQRSLDRFETVPIRDSEGASNPFFSPDSRWLGFSTVNALKKVLLEGGTPQTICAATDVRGVSWGARGTILFSAGTAGLWSVPADGGPPKKLATPDPKKREATYPFPEILPGGDAALFSVYTTEFQIAVLSLKTGAHRILLPGLRAHYTTSGHLVFNRGNSLLAAPFDPEKLELTGPAVSVLEGLLLVPPFYTPLFTISDDGTLVYASGTVNQTLVWVDRSGAVEPAVPEARAFEEPRLSPDGSRVAVTIRDANPDVWVFDLAQGTWMRLTFEAGEDETPIWTPDGRRVTYSSTRAGRPRENFWKPADGSGAEQLLFESNAHPHVSSWSPDGRALLYTEYGPATQGDLWACALEGSRTSCRPLLRTPANERAPRFAPDGRWLAYVSDESGRDEVYVQPFPGPGGRWQISYSGGREPIWSRDGRELFYRDGEKMMAVPVTTQPAFSAGSPRPLFEGDYVATRRGEAAYDISPDGRRFLMVRRDPRSAPIQLNVVLNWFEELKKKVPAKAR